MIDRDNFDAPQPVLVTTDGAAIEQALNRLVRQIAGTADAACADWAVAFLQAFERELSPWAYPEFLETIKTEIEYRLNAQRWL